MRLSSLRGQGVVALGDHLHCHVTGSPPNNQVLSLERVSRLEELRELKKRKYEFITLSLVVYEQERES